MASPPDQAARVYRIVSPKYPPFDGTGAFRFGSRWVSPGRYVVHAADSYALAVLENLVHWQTTTVPASLVCVQADLPDDVFQQEIDFADMPKKGARSYKPYREIGDDWYDSGDSVALWVPSVISPDEYNVLINQRHPDFAKISVHDAIAARIDPRLKTPRK